MDKGLTCCRLNRSSHHHLCSDPRLHYPPSSSLYHHLQWHHRALWLSFSDGDSPGQKPHLDEHTPRLTTTHNTMLRHPAKHTCCLEIELLACVLTKWVMFLNNIGITYIALKLFCIFSRWRDGERAAAHDWCDVMWACRRDDCWGKQDEHVREQVSNTHIIYETQEHNSSQPPP